MAEFGKKEVHKTLEEHYAFAKRNRIDAATYEPVEVKEEKKPRKKAVKKNDEV